MGCFGFNSFQLVAEILKRRLISSGLHCQIICLENGSEIECWLPRNVGDDKPALLLVHGFGTDGVIEWVHQIQALSKHYSLYIPNLLFFGRSTTTSEQRSEHFQAECLMNMMKKLGVKEWHALGTSYGGFVVFRMSHLYPKMVKKVIIASSGVCMAPSNNENLLQAFNASHISEILIPRTPQMAKKSLNLVLHKPNNLMPKFFYADMVEVANRNRAEKIELLDGLEIGSKESLDLPELTQRTMILWGQEDRVFSLDLAYQLKKHLGQQAVVVTIPETGHSPHNEKPAHFNQCVLEFLKERTVA